MRILRIAVFFIGAVVGVIGCNYAIRTDNEFISMILIAYVYLSCYLAAKEIIVGYG
jgi:hypothetical protein